MREYGGMIKPMGMECSLIQIMLDMKVTGWMTCNMAKESRLGIMEQLVIQALSIKERRMAKASSNGRMEVSTKEILLMGNSKVLENTISLI